MVLLFALCCAADVIGVEAGSGVPVAGRGLGAGGSKGGKVNGEREFAGIPSKALSALESHEP